MLSVHSTINANKAAAQPVIAEEWIQYIDEAFAKPGAELLPSVVVFPAVDGENKIREGGIALSTQANLFYELTPQRRSHSSFLSAIHTFRDGGEYEPGLEIDHEEVTLYAKSLCADFYYFPLLIDTENGYQFTLNRTDSKNESKKQILSQTIQQEELLKLPGMIALAIFQDQQGKLTDEERQYISTPQVRNHDALLQLERLIRGDIMGVKEDLEKVSWFLHENPTCFTGWLVAINREYMHETMLDRIRPHNQKVSEEVVRDLLGPADARLDRNEFRKILNRASLYKSDPVYMLSLSEQFFFLGNEEVIDHFFKKWDELSNNYDHVLTKAVAYTLGAWHIRGNGSGSDVPLKSAHLFNKYTERFGETLTEALEVNPEGWYAHCHQIGYATESETRTSIAKEAFDAAVKLRPRSKYPYKYYYRYLQPRWGGDAYELLEFANECISTQYWGTEIPEQGIRVINELADQEFISGFDRQIFTVPEVWETYKHYYKSFKEHGPQDKEQQYDKLNEFAMYGAFGGHLEEVNAAFEEIASNGPSEKVFWDGYTYGFLHDYVQTETTTGIDQELATLKTMLCLGAFEYAQHSLDELIKQDANNASFYEHFQNIIDFGNQLFDKGELDIAPKQIVELFEGSKEHLEAQEDRLIIRVPPNTTTQLISPFGFLNCDLSGDIHFVSGNGKVILNLHTRSMHDIVDLHFNRERKSVEMHRNNQRFREFLNQESDDADFIIRKLTAGDIISTNNNPDWEVRSYSEGPSGFGLTVISGEQEFVVEVSNLKLNFLNEDE
ncbi:MAG: hypothetical protein R3C11_24395 [Planctomycetaceae bacterium]